MSTRSYQTIFCCQNRQGCDRYKYFGSLNPIQNQIRLVLLVLTDTKIRYHYGQMTNFVSPNQMQIQIGLVLLVRPDTRDDTSQPRQQVQPRQRRKDPRGGDRGDGFELGVGADERGGHSEMAQRPSEELHDGAPLQAMIRQLEI